MLRKYLSCDICGDKWDITNTKFSGQPYPGTRYIHSCIKDGKRLFIIQKGNVAYDDDERIERDDMDICDKCYNKIDRFIFDLAKGGEEDGN